MAYYNDSDPNCVAWLDALTTAGLIGAGRVDGRPIEEIKPREVSGLETSHFFAGIGGWDYAFRLAGWPEGRPVWTGSCPCQPFSTAGKRRAHEDSRHVWPHFLRLVAECRPHVVFGEQVAGNLGLEWLAGVRVDLEALGYAVGWCELCAAGVAAPHRRQRLYWVAHSGRECRREVRPASRSKKSGEDVHDQRRLPDIPLAESDGRQPRDGRVQRGGQHGQQSADGRAGSLPVGVGNADGEGRKRRGLRNSERANKRPTGAAGGQTGSLADPAGQREGSIRRVLGGPGAVGRGGAEFWSGADTVACRDGKIRRVPQPGILPVADGLPDDLASVWLALAGGYPLTDKRFKGRPALIRGAGNAIVPQVAARFVRAFMDSEGAC